MSIEYVYPSQTPRYDKATSAFSGDGKPLFGTEEFSFKDILDSVNPLQQLPVIGTLYRAVSGDDISTVSKLVGGALFGGPIGFLVSAINAGLDAATGGDVGEHLVAFFTGGSEETQVAQAASAYQKIQELG